ncbi:MAG: TetR family transcriptional regulator [Hydrocarboniphaga sp.]|nr:TetR family transcriptional regulator [Hydrocarboniphaga sp.]
MSEPGSVAALDAPARWEERSATRVLEVGRDQILERSRRIVEVAYALLEQAGLDGVTIRAVLKNSRLSRRAFYERFEGKDELMLAVFEHTIRLAAGHYRDQVANLADPLARLEMIVTSIVLGRSTDTHTQSATIWRRGAAMSREHLRLAQSRPEDLQTALSPLLEVIALQLSDGMSVGSIRSTDPRRLAALLYNLVSTTAHTELLTRETAAPDPARMAGLARDLWFFCLRAIAA